MGSGCEGGRNSTRDRVVEEEEGEDGVEGERRRQPYLTLIQDPTHPTPPLLRMLLSVVNHQWRWASNPKPQ